MEDSPSSQTYHHGQIKVPVLNISLEQLILILYPSFLIPAVYLWITYLRKSRQAALSPKGCRKLGLSGASNLEDEYNDQYEKGINNSDSWKIKALLIHPIKSCAPVELDELEIELAGPKWDRKFCFAELLPPTNVKEDASEEEKKPKWTFRTLRQPGYENLALVKPEVWVPKDPERGKSISRRTERDGALVVKYPNIPTGPLAFLDRFMIRRGMVPSENSFQVPLVPPSDHSYPRESVQIWLDSPTWLNYGEHIPDDFRQFIGAKNPVTLFRVDPEAYREVFRCAPRKEQVGYQPIVGFADSYPINLLNIASVRDIGRKVKSSIPDLSVRRFRTNLLVSGPQAYDEDDWKRIAIAPSPDINEDKQKNAYQLYCSSRTLRCRLPNVDPDTAERHPSEPDKTMKSFRCIDQGNLKNAALGLQLVPASLETITVRVGDRVEVLERGEHFYINQGG